MDEIDHNLDFSKLGKLMTKLIKSWTSKYWDLSNPELFKYLNQIFDFSKLGHLKNPTSQNLNVS